MPKPNEGGAVPKPNEGGTVPKPNEGGAVPKPNEGGAYYRGYLESYSFEELPMPAGLRDACRRTLHGLLFRMS